MEGGTIARQLFLIVLLLLGMVPLYGDDTSMVDFFQLESFVDHPERTPRQIQIRGFLYLKGSTLVLAAEPDLKSCCVGSKSKQHSQLLVSGGEMITGFDSASPVMLQGTLTRHSDHPFLYHLEDAAMVQEEPRAYTNVLVAGGVLVAASMMLLIRRKG